MRRLHRLLEVAHQHQHAAAREQPRRIEERALPAGVFGLLLAFAEQLTIRYAPIPAGYAEGVPLVLLMVFLLVRPTGLLQAREARA